MIQWHFNYYVFKRGTPVSASCYIIDSCNYKCTMCDIRMRKDPEVYPRELQEKHIDALSEIGVIYYSISGGEPTLVRDLPERLAYASRKIPYVHLVTNGSTMTRDLATRLGQSGLTEISISIDGVDELHGQIRGVKNAYTKAWRALALLRDHAPSIQVVVNSILSSKNFKSLKLLRARLDSEFPNVYQKFLPLTQHELFLTEDRDVVSIPGDDGSIEDLRLFIEDAIRNPRVVNSKVFLRKAFRHLTGEIDVIPEQKRCLYPYHAIEFDSKGVVYPCITGSCRSENTKDHPNIANLSAYFKSDEYRGDQRKLESCEKCRGSMMLCYYEPRINFPLHNLLRGLLTS